MHFCTFIPNPALCDHGFILQSAEQDQPEPACIAQLDSALDLKTRGCGFDSRAGQPNKHCCLLDETLNRGPV